MKVTSSAEEEMAMKERRSIIAAKDIPKGQRITREMLVVKRPGMGIPPKYMDVIVGRESKQHIQEDEPITWNMI